LVASALLNAPGEKIGREEIGAAVKAMLGQLERRGATLADSLTGNDFNGMLDRHIDRLLDRTVQAFIDKGWVKPLGGEPAAYQVISKHRPRLDIYKNNAISPLVPAALTSLVILSRKGTQKFDERELRVRYRSLRSMFDAEFFLGQQPVSQQLRQALGDFVAAGILEKVGGSQYRIQTEGSLRLFAGFLKPYLEAYASTFSMLGKNRYSSLEALVAEGRRRVESKRASMESVSTPIIRNAMRRYGQPLQVGTLGLINEALTLLSGGGE
jgi:glycerol-3-phosphate O-acyltransferase